MLCYDATVPISPLFSPSVSTHYYILVTLNWGNKHTQYYTNMSPSSPNTSRYYCQNTSTLYDERDRRVIAFGSPVSIKSYPGFNMDV